MHKEKGADPEADALAVQKLDNGAAGRDLDQAYCLAICAPAAVRATATLLQALRRASSMTLVLV